MKAAIFSSLFMLLMAFLLLAPNNGRGNIIDREWDLPITKSDGNRTLRKDGDRNTSTGSDIQQDTTIATLTVQDEDVKNKPSTDNSVILFTMNSSDSFKKLDWHGPLSSFILREFARDAIDSNENSNRTDSIASSHLKPCRLPTALLRAEMICIDYPSERVCTQTCFFGYTFESGIGIRRRLECKYDENQWRPSEPDMCLPFVDCGLTMVSNGTFKCRHYRIDKGTLCSISCFQFNDNEAVPFANYECDIHGNWSPNVPFCVRPGSGLMLANPPTGAKTVLELD